MYRFEHISVSQFGIIAMMHIMNKEFVQDQVDYMQNNGPVNILALVYNGNIQGLLGYSNVDSDAGVAVQRLVFLVRINDECNNVGTLLVKEYTNIMEDVSLIYMDESALGFYKNLGLEGIGKYHNTSFDMTVGLFDKNLQNVDLLTLSDEQQLYIKAKLSLT